MARAHLPSEDVGAPIPRRIRGAFAYRLVVLSRNLTADRSWDTILWMDGRRGESNNDSSEPLADFVGALPGSVVTPLASGRQAILAELAEELRGVEWELPSGVREARFHPIGPLFSDLFRSRSTSAAIENW